MGWLARLPEPEQRRLGEVARVAAAAVARFAAAMGWSRPLPAGALGV
jgi:hypothetical protein